MFLRFTTQFVNVYGELETGVFIALVYLRDDHPLTQDHDKQKLKEIPKWFDQKLNKPTKFSTGISKKNADVSLSLFKDSAIEHIKKMQSFIEIAVKYDMMIERHTSKNTGYIVFEDD